MGLGEMLFDTMADVIKSKGIPVHRGTPYCKEHLATHPNCQGCESHPGCDKLTKLVMLMLQVSMLPQPTSLGEIDKVGKELMERIDKILEEE